MEQKTIYIYYFWKYVSKEQIEDILELSIESISEYVLILWKEFYNTYKVANQSKIAKIVSKLEFIYK